jgi:hypothetical protein
MRASRVLRFPTKRVVTTLAHHRHRSQSLWFLADVFGLFSNNVGPFSFNVVLGSPLFSANVGPKQRMLSSQAIYVLGPLQIAARISSFCQRPKPLKPTKTAQDSDFGQGLFGSDRVA